MNQNENENVKQAEADLVAATQAEQEAAAELTRADAALLAVAPEPKFVRAAEERVALARATHRAATRERVAAEERLAQARTLAQRAELAELLPALDRGLVYDEVAALVRRRLELERAFHGEHQAIEFQAQRAVASYQARHRRAVALGAAVDVVIEAPPLPSGFLSAVAILAAADATRATGGTADPFAVAEATHRALYGVPLTLTLSPLERDGAEARLRLQVLQPNELARQDATADRARAENARTVRERLAREEAERAAATAARIARLRRGADDGVCDLDRQLADRRAS